MVLFLGCMGRCVHVQIVFCILWKSNTFLNVSGILQLIMHWLLSNVYKEYTIPFNKYDTFVICMCLHYSRQLISSFIWPK